MCSGKRTVNIDYSACKKIAKKHGITGVMA